MATYLDTIVADHRERAASLTEAVRADLAARARDAAAAGATRDFAGALRRGAAPSSVAARPPAVIAEIKRRSPSKGELCRDLDAARVARAYEDAGAACVSVLTDGPHFGGSAADLVAARAAVALPVLRKDFTVAESDVNEARLMGADAVLLIAAVLGDDELANCLGVAGELGLAALVEVHDEDEVVRALASGATVIGVNQRDLHSFAVDTERACRVVTAIPSVVVTVAESGIRDATDLGRLGAAGFHAVLVGEALVSSPDPGAALRALRAGVGSGLGVGAGERT